MAADLSVLVLVTCYGGDGRRYESPGYAADRSYILRQWDEALARTGCSSDVCFVSHGGDENYLAYLEQMRGRWTVLDRPNTGHQQGGWQEGWQAFPDYDHYIIADDDYIPVLPRFDRRLVHQIAYAGADYACQYLWGEIPMMNGIITRTALEKLGGFPGAGYSGQHMADQAQGELGHAVNAAGLRMVALEDFRCLIPGERRHPDYDYRPDKPLLFIPSQWYAQVDENRQFDFATRADPS